MVVSAIVIEYGEIPARPKFARVLEKVPSLPNLLDLAPCGFTSSDQRDQALLDCAVAGDVDFIVTGNRRHFPDPC
jgi:predicted nucleic acid-binding protein